ncbi:MAG: hypothetical protein E7G00_24155, partial [Escherichia coli]|nr:hypothetical protein [Escherichia coli]
MATLTTSAPWRRCRRRITSGTTRLSTVDSTPTRTVSTCASWPRRAFPPVAQGLHAGAGIAQEGHARLGQLGAGLAPFEQARAEDFLQFLEGLGDRRLRHRHGIRRLGEAALAGDFEEAGEVAELDAVVEVHGAAVAASGAGMVPNGRVGNEVWRAA